jgi:hypothetical protein
MRLVRFAIGVFPEKAEISSGTSVIGNADVSMVKATSSDPQRQHFLITAKTDLAAWPERDASARLVIPNTPREECELAIDVMCNVVATFNGCSRGILSPTPTVALECVGKEERDYVEASQGIYAVDRGQSAPRNRIPLREDLLTAVSDRLGGVALLAEAYTEGEASRFREFLRFFEFAFRTPVTDLSKKLHQFLAPVFGYTRAEINKWLAARDPLSHADLKKAQGIATTADVQRFLLRMEQAVLDVLFNKAKWADKSRDRRNVWMPDAYTSSETGTILVKQGSKLSLVFRRFDDFDVYPRMLNATVTTIEESWYVKVSRENQEEPPTRTVVTAPTATNVT